MDACPGLIAFELEELELLGVPIAQERPSLCNSSLSGVVVILEIDGCAGRDDGRMKKKYKHQRRGLGPEERRKIGLESQSQGPTNPSLLLFLSHSCAGLMTSRYTTLCGCLARRNSVE